MPHLVQQETTLAYLENQIAAALTLQSSHEYRHWLLIYARYLVNEGETQRATLPLQLFVCMCDCTSSSLAQHLVPGLAAHGRPNQMKHLFPVVLQYSGILACCEQTVVWGNSAICAALSMGKKVSSEVMRVHHVHYMAAATGASEAAAAPCKM